MGRHQCETLCPSARMKTPYLVPLLLLLASCSCSPLTQQEQEEQERIFGLFGSKETTTPKPGLIQNIVGGLFGGEETTTTTPPPPSPKLGFLDVIWNMIFPTTTTTTTTTTPPPTTTTKCTGLIGGGLLC